MTDLTLRAVISGICGVALAQLYGQSALLPQGWRISPVGAAVQLAGDFPSRIVVTDGGKALLILTCGFHHQGVSVIDTESHRLESSIDLGKAFGDMAFDRASGKLFVALGGSVNANGRRPNLPRDTNISIASDAAVLGVQVERNVPLIQTAIRIPGLTAKDQFATGVALGHDGSLYVVNINNDSVYRLARDGQTLQAQARCGYGAYRDAVSPDGSVLAVSNWGDESVSLLAIPSLSQIANVSTGIHPTDLVFGPDGRLFVANAGSNSVSIIDHDQLVETVKTSLSPSDPVGSTPDAVAIDPTERRLYVANADNNDVAVINIERKGHSKIEGFIPTGWYPSALAISSDGKKLFIGVAKGFRSRANFPPSEPGPRTEPDIRHPYDFVGDTLTGYVSIVDLPDDRSLAQLTKMVIHNTPVGRPSAEDGSHAAIVRSAVFPHIRHVLYVIRENRTYDQVFGDLPEGNGDPALTMFGQNITPNVHKIAKEWVLFDNLFVNGEVSENGHQWSDAAYATAFTSQAWLQTYGGRPEPKATESELGADERLRSSPAGYLWDNCARHGVSFRTYGEFAYFHSGRDEGPRFVAKGLEGHASLAWLKLASAGWTDITKGRDPDLAEVFIDELRAAGRTGIWPGFMVMSLGEDHTHALRPGHYTPSAMVASNDQALGQIVEAVSNSRFWPETAIFVVEDDAQDGPDHVDCRRTVGLVISPYVKRHIVDSTMYTTASMIHTMELILGLPPMTQFDRAAMPMYKAFSAQPNFAAYENLLPQTDLFAKNPLNGPGVVASMKLDFSSYDRADPEEMNRLLWNAMKPGVRMPAPVRNAFLREPKVSF